MMSKRKRMSAAELMASLQSDAEWNRQDKDREARRSAATAQLKKELEPEQAPLLAELADVGHTVSSVWELVNCQGEYPEAIPTLTKYLSMVRHPVLRQGIARALTVPEARGVAGRRLLQELVSQKDWFFRHFRGKLGMA